MKTYKILLLSFVNLIFASTALQYFRIGDIVPNTSIVIIVLFVMHLGYKEALIFSIFAGCLNDMFFTMALGPNVIILPLITTFMMLFDEVFSKVNYLGLVVLTGGGTVVYHVVYFIFMYFLRNNIDAVVLFTQIVPEEIVYNIVLSVGIYSVTRKRYSDLEGI